MHRTERWTQLRKVYKGLKIYRALFGKIELDRDLKLLLLIGGLYALSVALSNTFVNVYLWKQNNSYFTIALFNLCILVAQQVMVILAGRWAKQVDRVIVLRSGVLALSIFYGMVLLCGDQASQWAALLGATLGIGLGLYWLAFNVLTFEVTEPDTRDIFNGFFGLLTSLAGMIGPFFAGWLITRMTEWQGYITIFALSLSFFVLTVILSFFLKRRPAEGRFMLGAVLGQQLTFGWRHILFAQAAQGMREGSFMFLILIWVFMATRSEMAVGIYGLVTSGVSLVFYYIAGRFIKTHQRQEVILYAGLTLSLAVFLIAFQLTYERLLIYGILTAAAFPLLTVPFLSLSYDVIGQRENAASMRVEYIVARELFLNGGRLISVLLFLGVISLFDPLRAMPFYILLIGQTQLLIHLFIRPLDPFQKTFLA